MKLFVIGNGFDRAHKLPTSYEDFRQYLLEQYPDSSADDFIIPEGRMDADGGYIYEDIDVVSYLLRLVSNVEGEEWNTLEHSLGFLEYEEILDSLETVLDDDGDPDLFKNLYNTEDLSSSLIEPTLKIADLFSDWIDTIEIDEVEEIENFSSLIDPEQDRFLTFNYTSTLESVYGAQRVCHIHGEQGTELVFGHGNDEDSTERYMDDYTGSETALSEIDKLLRKDTTSAISKNKEFFEDLMKEPVDEVYSFGFSFSKVDEIYIQEICKSLSEDVTWYLNDHSTPEELKKQQEVILLSGFRGKFSTYHI